MKKQIVATFWILLSIFNLFGQKGTVKIFSEIKEVKVYLNEEFKGIDIITLDSVAEGSHYLKVTKDSVIIYGELITVNANAITSILIKNSIETQNKLLASKYKETQLYKQQRLEVLMSMNYVTETTGQTKSTYYPGYYVATGVSRSNSQSTTTAVLDWFVTQGGVKKLGDVEFSQIVNNQDALRRYESDRKNYKSAVKGANAAGLVWGLIFAGGGLWLGIDGLKNDNIGLGLVGMGSMLIGLKFLDLGAMKEKSYKWQSHYMSADEAVRYANEYNQQLKKRLGLPENFEAP